MALAIFSTNISAQTCRIQFIHNSTDTSIDVFDIYVGGVLKADDLHFHQATLYMNITSASPITVAVAPASSESVDEAFYTANYTFATGAKYILVANGVMNPEGFNPVQPFGFGQFTGAIESITSSASTEVLFCNGATDAPTLDFSETELIQLTAFENIAFGNFSGYQTFLTANYTFEITNSSNDELIGSFGGPFSSLGLGGLGVTILSSGFLNQSANNDAIPFGLWLAKPAGGDLIPLPVYELNVHARAQFIHNSADVDLGMVDVYVNGNLVIDNIQFRTASPYLDVAVGENVSVAVAPGNSSSASEAYFSAIQNFYSGRTYTYILDGVMNESGYNPAPALTWNVHQGFMESATFLDETLLLFHNGATDAPLIDVVQTSPNTSQLVDDLSYGAFSEFVGMETANYIFAYTDATGADTVEHYLASFSDLSLQGVSATILTSGFLNPAANSNGASFGIWLAPASGGSMIELLVVPPPPVYTQVQFIHNTADAQLATVDVYLNGQIIMNDFSFQQATPFIQMPAEVDATIVIAPSNSENASNPLSTFQIHLFENIKYVAVLAGILSPGYNPAPALRLDLFPGATEFSQNAGQTDVLIYQGSTDTPAMDITEMITTTQYANDLIFGNYKPYMSIESSTDKVIRISNGTGSIQFGDYNFLTTGWQVDGAAVTLLTGGFLNPLNNQNGPALRPWMATADGVVHVLPMHVAVDEYSLTNNLRLFPNPATEEIKFAGQFIQSGACQYAVYSVTGNRVTDEQKISGGAHVFGTIDVGELSNGLYTLKISNNVSSESSIYDFEIENYFHRKNNEWPSGHFFLIQR